MQNIYMTEALKEAYLGIREGHGGPFGAVIVKEGNIVGRGHNCVLKETDPTLHGEVMAIKDACRNLNTLDLSDCVLYTTAEPCPMCLGAILWANIKTVYYGCNRKDTESIGFRDNAFYKLLEKRENITVSELDREACLSLFEAYSNIENKTLY
jgi:tRNA(Arg) A34 adenosine deaminase TadA